MTLTRKTLTISLVTFAGLVLVVYTVSSRVLRGTFDAVERRNSQESVVRVDASIKDIFTNMESTADDWGAWDETYAFAHHPNAKFRKTNLTLATFNTLKLDAMLITGPAGNVVYAGALNADSTVLSPAPPATCRALTASGTLVRFRKLTEVRHGFLLINDQPYMVVGHPILTNDRKGPIAGAIVIGRRLDAGEIQRIGDLTGHPFQLRLLNASSPLEDFA